MTLQYITQQKLIPTKGEKNLKLTTSKVRITEYFSLKNFLK